MQTLLHVYMPPTMQTPEGSYSAAVGAGALV